VFSRHKEKKKPWNGEKDRGLYMVLQPNSRTFGRGEKPGRTRKKKGKNKRSGSKNPSVVSGNFGNRRGEKKKGKQDFTTQPDNQKKNGTNEETGQNTNFCPQKSRNTRPA